MHKTQKGHCDSRIAITILGFLLCLFVDPGAGAQQNAKNVIILSGGRGRVSINQMESSLRAHFSGQVNFSIVDLENPRFEEKAYRDNLEEALRTGYANEVPDLIVAVSDPALQFAAQYRNKMFPGVPIVFMSQSMPLPEKMRPRVTGVSSSSGISETIDLALRLQPDTQVIAVVTDIVGAERNWLTEEQSQLLRRRDRVREIDIVGPASPETIQKVSELPPHTVLLFQLYPHDSNQPAFGALDVLAAVSPRRPVYSILPPNVGRGAIASASYDPVSDAVLAGQLAARVLSGERPENIPVVRNTKQIVSVDWRQLQQWHIPESALPPGAVVLYREPTLWQRNRKYAIPTLLLIVLQALLIAGLLWQRARKRRAELVLRESEERFRRLADTTPSLIWMSDAHARVTYLNDRWITFTGPDPRAAYADRWVSYVHPDDLPRIRDLAANALKTRQPFSREYRLRRSDGVYRWMFDVASPRVDSDGSFVGFIGSAIDITDQKLALEALEKVSGRLIEAQESERRRIARELHDDICQRLAFLSMELDHARRKPGMSARDFEEIRKHCSEIADDVQALSHELHSSKLDYLGIVAALRGFCNEFSTQHHVTVDFNATNMPDDIPQDVSLCLFRVAQEALHNAMKHSQTSTFAVELRATENEVRLEVRDWGEGFDVEQARQNRGLGLLSMLERVNLVHGKFSIESRSGEGTRIVAAAPLPVASDAALAADPENEVPARTGTA